MTIRERLQALLDGKALKVRDKKPVRLTGHGDGLQFRYAFDDWRPQERGLDYLLINSTCEIYEEPKPVERPQVVTMTSFFTGNVDIDHNATLKAVLDYIDAKIDELRREVKK